MRLDLRPGRRCLLIAPSFIEAYAGKECTIIRFIGKRFGCNADGEHKIVAEDWWEITVQGLPPAPAFYKDGYGARAPWLIPLPDDDEGKKMFGECEKKRDILKTLISKDGLRKLAEERQ